MEKLSSLSRNLPSCARSPKSTTRTDWIDGTEPDATAEERERFGLKDGDDVTEWANCQKHGRYPFRGRSGNYSFVFFDSCPACREAMVTEKAYGRIAIPRRYAQATVAGYVAKTPEQAAVKRAVADFCRNIDARLDHGDSLIFFGGSGTGKTHLACAIARCAHKSGRTALFIKARALVAEIRATWKKDSVETEPEAIKRFTDLDLLVIDEVGAQFGTEAEALHLFDVIGERYAEMKSTILLSNLPLDVPGEEGKGLRQYIGDAAFDRFCEDGSQALAFTWRSHRGQSDIEPQACRAASAS